MIVFLSIPDSGKHLAAILRELKELVQWRKLGLELGLSLPTLDKIAIKHQNDVDRCKMDMMDKWLQGIDNVSDQGGVTKKALVEALERAEFIDLAIKLDPSREKSS